MHILLTAIHLHQTLLFLIAMSLYLKHLTLACCILSVSACSKKKEENTTTTTPAGPISYFNIEFNGKKYREVADSTNPISIDSIFTGKNTTTGAKEYQMQIYWQGKYLTISLAGQKADTTTATGTYYTSLISNKIPKPVSSANVILVWGDTTRTYVGDDMSAINVTTANSALIKGTINFTLFNNGGSYPATGDFEFHK